MSEELMIGIENELHNINLNLIELTKEIKELRNSSAMIPSAIDELRIEFSEAFPK